MEVPVESVNARVEGDLDLRGTLGMARDVRAGFESIRLRIDIDAPEATDEQLAKLGEKTERYCTVAQTLMQPPPLSVELFRSA